MESEKHREDLQANDSEKGSSGDESGASAEGESNDERQEAETIIKECPPDCPNVYDAALAVDKMQSERGRYTGCTREEIEAIQLPEGCRWAGFESWTGLNEVYIIYKDGWKCEQIGKIDTGESFWLWRLNK